MSGGGVLSIPRVLSRVGVVSRLECCPACAVQGGCCQCFAGEIVSISVNVCWYQLDRPGQIDAADGQESGA